MLGISVGEFELTLKKNLALNKFFDQADKLRLRPTKY